MGLGLALGVSTVLNGAGKSTLLKILIGTSRPTDGEVGMGGRAAALLELRFGFHPDFSGRQNAMMAGQLMGLPNPGGGGADAGGRRVRPDRGVGAGYRGKRNSTARRTASRVEASDRSPGVTTSRLSGALGPLPVGSCPAGASAWGVHELIGSGGEWTESPFGPFPGFPAHIPGYGGYSADFFDGKHYVLKAASWATDQQLIRRSVRNW